mmetsp:Transcript_3378/g.11075  ORF Transcript_3378/g.11075 Transcript_3378/m.11075 type:complete len:155 (-) Transcript_3378:51-515(-)
MASSDDIREIFKLIDVDSTGKIKGDQICFALRALEKNPTSEQAKSIGEKYKGGITLADFEKLYKSDASGRHPVEQDKEMRDVLEVLDKDGAGYINVVELRNILGNLGDVLEPALLDQLFKEVKVDMDGMVSFDEFVDLVCNSYPLHFQGKVQFS